MHPKKIFEYESSPYIKIDDELQPIKIDNFTTSKGWNVSFEGEFVGECINCKDLIKKVVFHNPATVVYWKDGTKTVVKCQDEDTYDKELGLAMCCSKKLFGNKGNFNNIFKKFIGDENK